MGANSSKPPGRDDSNIQPVRRQIGKRSSVNFLSRLDSRSTSTQLPEQTVSHRSPDSSEDSTLYPITPSSSEQTAAESTSTTDSNRGSVFRHKATLSSETQQTVIGPARKSSSDKDEVAEDAEEAEEAEEADDTAGGALDREEEKHDLPERDESRVETPLARSAPIPKPAPTLLLPPTSLLGSESPSKYGFDEVWASAENMMMSAKRRTMSGPELFSVSFLCIPLGTLSNVIRLPKTSRDHAAPRSRLLQIQRQLWPRPCWIPDLPTRCLHFHPQLPLQERIHLGWASCHRKSSSPRAFTTASVAVTTRHLRTSRTTLVPRGYCESHIPIT